MKKLKTRRVVSCVVLSSSPMNPVRNYLPEGLGPTRNFNLRDLLQIQGELLHMGFAFETDYGLSVLNAFIVGNGRLLSKRTFSLVVHLGVDDNYVKIKHKYIVPRLLWGPEGPALTALCVQGTSPDPMANHPVILGDQLCL